MTAKPPGEGNDPRSYVRLGLPHDLPHDSDGLAQLPPAASVDEKPGRKPIFAFVPSLGNFSVQYNFNAVTIALVAMDKKYPQSGHHAWVTDSSKAVVFVGCIFGQLVMGYVGDAIGRNRAMTLTLALAATTALLSAVLPWGSEDQIYLTIIACRFLLGAGVGGVYPLSATKAAEDTGANASATEKSKNASLAFFWQTPGAMAPYAVAWALQGMALSTSLEWRLILGLGAVPAAIVAFASHGAVESAEFREAQSAQQRRQRAAAAAAPENGNRAHAASWHAVITSLSRREMLVLLSGTGGSWFIYDVRSRSRSRPRS